MNAMKYLDFIISEFERAENLEKALFAKGYLRNQFESLGLSSPVRAQIYKEHLQKNGLPNYTDLFPIVEYCWERPEREYQYLGMNLLDSCRKLWEEDILDFFKVLILSKSWWDTIDYIAPTLIGHYFQIFPEHKQDIVLDFARSDNFWNQRTAIIFQLKYKDKTDLDLLQECILINHTSKEFFIRKAIGWSLRQYSRTDPDWVIQFIETHNLSPLSKREGLKWLIHTGYIKSM